MIHTLCLWLAARLNAVRDERGASTVETVIIASALAAMAIATMVAIRLLVDGKVAGISL